MSGKKYIKITAALTVLTLAIGFTFSRLEVSKAVKGGITGSLLNTDTKVGSGSQDSDLDENTSRVYFSIFRFISNLVPASN